MAISHQPGAVRPVGTVDISILVVVVKSFCERIASTFTSDCMLSSLVQIRGSRKGPPAARSSHVRGEKVQACGCKCMDECPAIMPGRHTGGRSRQSTR